MISEQDRLSLIAVRDFLASGALDADPHFKLDMDKTGYSTDCGIVACIGGWVGIHQQLGTLDLPLVQSTLANSGWLLINNYVWEQNDDNAPLGDLYYPPETVEWSAIKPHHAVKAIDNFLKDGDPRWSEVVSPENLIYVD